MAEFESYAKIPRLRGVRMTITEKIDGTNAQILVPESDSEPLQFGSRNRWLKPGGTKAEDNFDFASWAASKGDVWRRLGPGRHYGEWYGAGIGPRRYGLAERRFALFNVYRFAKSGLPDGLPNNVELVPVLYSGEYSLEAIEQSKALLARDGSRIGAALGFNNPEGIVVRIQGGPGEIVWKWTTDGDALTPTKLAKSEHDKLPLDLKANDAYMENYKLKLAEIKELRRSQERVTLEVPVESKQLWPCGPA